MIIYKSHCLHKGVGSSWAEKLPATLLEILTERLRSLGDTGNGMVVIAFANMRLFGFWLPLPNVGAKTAEFVNNLDGSMRIIDCRLDFSAVANNAAILQQLFNIAVIVLSDFIKIKIEKCLAKILTLSQDGEP